jgi:hypothetical protein
MYQNNAVVTALNTLTNDTLNGVAATTINTNVTPLTTGPLSIDADGIVTVAANTPSGTYAIPMHYAHWCRSQQIVIPLQPQL